MRSQEPLSTEKGKQFPCIFPKLVIANTSLRTSSALQESSVKQLTNEAARWEFEYHYGDIRHILPFGEHASATATMKDAKGRYQRIKYLTSAIRLDGRGIMAWEVNLDKVCKIICGQCTGKRGGTLARRTYRPGRWNFWASRCNGYISIWVNRDIPDGKVLKPTKPRLFGAISLLKGVKGPCFPSFGEFKGCVKRDRRYLNDD